MSNIPNLEELLDYGEEYPYPDSIMSDYFMIDPSRKKNNSLNPKNQNNNSNQNSTSNSNDSQSTDNDFQESNESTDGESQDYDNFKNQESSQETKQRQEPDSESSSQSSEEESSEKSEEQTSGDTESSQETKQRQEPDSESSSQSSEEELSEKSEEQTSGDTESSQETKQSQEQDSESSSQSSDKEQSEKGEEQTSGDTESSQETKQSQEQDDENSTQSSEEESEKSEGQTSGDEESKQNDGQSDSSKLDENLDLKDENKKEEDNDFDDLMDNYDEDNQRNSNDSSNSSGSHNASSKLNDITATQIYRTLKKLVSISYETYQKGTYKYNKKEVVKHYLTNQKFRIMDDLISPTFKPDIYVFDLSPSNDKSLEMYVNAISSVAIKGSLIYLTYNEVILRKLEIKKAISKGINVHQVANNNVQKYAGFDCTVYDNDQTLYEELKNIQDRKIYIFSDFDISSDISKLSQENSEIVWFSTEKSGHGSYGYDLFFYREYPTSYVGYYVETSDIKDIGKFISEKNKNKYKRRPYSG